MMEFEVGAAVEFKRERGLGGWERGTFAGWPSNRTAQVRDTRGVLVETDRGLVRAPKKAEAARRALAKSAAIATLAGGGVPDGIVRGGSAALRAQPKKRAPVRSAGYLDFVRAKPCCGCSAPPPSDPHHFGRRGIGQKTDDLRVVPLCRRCHDEWHDRGSIAALSSFRLPDRSLGASAVNRGATEQAFLRTQVDLLVEWISRSDPA